MIFKCNEEEMWAVGWHNHHYTCYLTTHGTDVPGKPAPKKRQDLTPTQIIASTFLVHKSLQNINMKWVGLIGTTDLGKEFWHYTVHGRQTLADGRLVYNLNCLLLPSLILSLLVRMSFQSGVLKRKMSKRKVFLEICVRVAETVGPNAKT